MAAGHPAVPDDDSLGAKQACLAGLVTGSEPAIGGDHAPPREPVPVPEEIAHRSGCSRIPRLLGHLSVAHHFTGGELVQDLHCGFGEHPFHGPFQACSAPAPGRQKVAS